MQHVNVGRRDNFSAVDGIVKIAARRSYSDDVILPNVFERTEEGIAVGSDSHITREPRKRCTLNVAGCNSKNIRVRTFQNVNRNAEPRNLEMANDRSSNWGRTAGQCAFPYAEQSEREHKSKKTK
jgi:hypothetical protein